jgi:hypothetical protein
VGRPAQVLHDDCLRQIPPKIIRELSEVILNENGLSESGEKN